MPDQLLYPSPVLQYLPKRAHPKVLFVSHFHFRLPFFQMSSLFKQKERDWLRAKFIATSTSSDSEDIYTTAFFGWRARSFRLDYYLPTTTIVTTPHDVFVNGVSGEIGKGNIFISSEFICPIMQMIHVDPLIMTS